MDTYDMLFCTLLGTPDKTQQPGQSEVALFIFQSILKYSFIMPSANLLNVCILGPHRWVAHFLAGVDPSREAYTFIHYYVDDFACAALCRLAFQSWGWWRTWAVWGSPSQSADSSIVLGRKEKWMSPNKSSNYWKTSWTRRWTTPRSLPMTAVCQCSSS